YRSAMRRRLSFSESALDDGRFGPAYGAPFDASTETPAGRHLTHAGWGVPCLASLCSALLLLPTVLTRFNDAGARWLHLLLLSYLIAVGLTPLVRALASRLGAVDQPSPRKIHHAATPLLGGVAVYLAFLIALLANARGTGDP